MRSRYSFQIPRPLTTAFSALLSLGLVGLLAASACDPLPDECQDDDNVCDGNVANQCQQPSPESRRMTTRIDCGPQRTCVVSVPDTGPTGSRLPICADQGAPDCPNVGDHGCDGNAIAVCTALADGRRTWVALDPCVNRCAPEAGTSQSGAPIAACR
jgi:hypothetical protein